MSVDYAEEIIEKITGKKKMGNEVDDIYYAQLRCWNCNKLIGSFNIIDISLIPFFEKVKEQFSCKACMKDDWSDSD